MTRAALLALVLTLALDGGGGSICLLRDGVPYACWDGLGWFCPSGC